MRQNDQSTARRRPLRIVGRQLPRRFGAITNVSFHIGDLSGRRLGECDRSAGVALSSAMDRCERKRHNKMMTVLERLRAAGAADNEALALPLQSALRFLSAGRLSYRASWWCASSAP
jgi:hypothetical protein